MNVLHNVRVARMRLKSMNTSEHENAEVIEDLFARAQTLIAQMNEAKLVAMKEAEKPFLDELKTIDDEMSMFITLLG